MTPEFDKETIIWLLESALESAKEFPSSALFPGGWRWATMVPDFQVLSVAIQYRDFKMKKKADHKDISQSPSNPDN